MQFGYRGQLYNTLFTREEKSAKSEFEMFSREHIFSLTVYSRKYLPAKIFPHENIFPRKYISAIFAAPQICRDRLRGLIFLHL